MHSPLSFFKEKAAPPLTLPPPRGTFFLLFEAQTKGARKDISCFGEGEKNRRGKRNRTEDDQQVHNKKRKENIKLCNN